VYNAIDNYIEAVVTEICPLITVFVLAYLLRKSLQNVIQRQATVFNPARQQNGVKHSRIKQMDSQITLMLMLQSISAIISFLPYGLDLLYSHITGSWYKTPLRVDIEKIITEVTHVVLYAFFASSFYISIISSSGFRREMKRIFQMNKVQPSYGDTPNTATIPAIQQN